MDLSNAVTVGFLFDASHVSQNYGGDILSRLNARISPIKS
jgi:hypothetical protein